MSDNPKNNQNSNSLHLAFDVGHSSIGWAVLNTADEVNVLGCGSVIFRADDCLASDRRAFRRQRRHIRSTRQRIERLKMLLLHLGVLSEEKLNASGCAWPWKLSAQVLQGGAALSWGELWDVLRWYAHNRGYDGNRRWSRVDDEDSEDTEKVKNAHALLEEHGTQSMAETVCAISGIDPLGIKVSAAIAPKDRFKSQNAAFDRDVVCREVRHVLEAHVGKLSKLDADVIRCLIGNDPFDDDAWQVIPVPNLQIPKRYNGSLLFGQLVPRFDNRIISTCPISDGKVPTRRATEFLQYRWAMQLANVRVATEGEGELRSLTAEERASIHKQMEATGHLTRGEFKTAVRHITACSRDNLETMLLHPDADKALVLDPVRKFTRAGTLGALFESLPENNRRLAINRWRRGKRLTLGQILAEAEEHDADTTAFENALAEFIANPPKARGKKKPPPHTRESVLNEFHTWDRGAPGRAPYARSVLAQATAEVMAGRDPREEGGCLFVTDEMRHAQLNRPLADQTNNHLVRHRLLILGRLLEDILVEYADSDKKRVAKATIEVNRDMRELSGKSNEAIAKELGLRLKHHKDVAGMLETELAGQGIPITAGLIRKARIAQDFDWHCPYTGKKFDIPTLAHGGVVREHIIPHRDRPTNALEALVMTFPEVNDMKGKRTAMQFIEEEGGKPIQGASHLTLFSPSRYRAFIESHTPKSDPRNRRSKNGERPFIEDDLRKWKRKKWLLLRDYEVKEFTLGDLTQTSQLVRLGAQVIEAHFQDGDHTPNVISLPGAVTGTVRKGWNMLGCLAQANPQVLDENGNPRTKTKIRSITHLHHALDACVLGLASHFIPNNGRVWQLIVKRRLTNSEKTELKRLNIYDFDAENRFRLRNLADRLKAQVGKRLAERRVVQHLPARMTGLRVKQNTWRVLGIEDGVATLRQRIRKKDGSLPAPKNTTEKTLKLLGPDPVPGGEAKLATLQGALVIPDNFGVALDPKPSIIPFHKVWLRLNTLREQNGGKWPRVLRNGMLIQVDSGSRAGLWRILSIKNTAAYGIALDLSKPDNIGLERPNAPIKNLLSEGLKIVACSLVGLDSSGVNYTKVTRRKKKIKS